MRRRQRSLRGGRDSGDHASPGRPVWETLLCARGCSRGLQGGDRMKGGLRAWLVAVAIALLACACGGGAADAQIASPLIEGETIASPLIEGGTTAAEGQFPWMAWVKYGGPEVEGATEEWEDSCSGTVISPDLVLTAGHCVSTEFGEGTAGNYTAVAGAVSRDSASAARSRVTKVIPYPDFKYGCGLVCGHDAGLLVLSKTISVPPIRLATMPSDEALVQPGADAFVAGWGITSPNGNTIPKELKYTETSLDGPGGMRTVLDLRRTAQSWPLRGRQRWAAVQRNRIRPGSSSLSQATARRTPAVHRSSPESMTSCRGSKNRSTRTGPPALAPNLELNALSAGPASPTPAFSGTAWPSGTIKLHIYHGSTPKAPKRARPKRRPRRGNGPQKPWRPRWNPGNTPHRPRSRAPTPRAPGRATRSPSACRRPALRAQGPTGPSGPTGPEGPQGVAGRPAQPEHGRNRGIRSNGRDRSHRCDRTRGSDRSDRSTGSDRSGGKQRRHPGTAEATERQEPPEQREPPVRPAQLERPEPPEATGRPEQREQPERPEPERRGRLDLPARREAKERPGQRA